MKKLQFLNKLYSYKSTVNIQKIKECIHLSSKNSNKDSFFKNWKITVNLNDNNLYVSGIVPKKILNLCVRFNNTSTNQRTDSLYDLLEYRYHKLISIAKSYHYSSAYATLGDNGKPSVKFNLHLISLEYVGDYSSNDKYVHSILIDTRHDKMNVSYNTDDKLSLDIPNDLKEAILLFLKCIKTIRFRKLNHYDMQCFD